MDVDAAGFVVDRMDMARMAILEAKQTVEKFSQPEDNEVLKALDEILRQVEQLDVRIKSSSYPY